MANFAQEVELQWGIEEKTRADSALRVIDTVLFDNGITWSEVINDEQRRNNIAVSYTHLWKVSTVLDP